MRSILFALSIVACLVIASPLQAQKRPLSPDEYIQSTSPLKTGGTITSRKYSNDQQLITIAQIPLRDEQVDRQRARAGAGQSNDASELQTVRRPAQANRYPYPGERTTVAQRIPSQLPTSQTGNNNVRRTAFQSGAFNPNVPRTAQNCACPPATGGFQVPATAAPAFTYQPIQAAAQPAPQGNLFVPGTNLNGQPIAPPSIQFQPNGACQPGCPPNNYTFGQSQVGFGQTGFGQGGFGNRQGIFNGRFRNWWRPLVSGTGAYQPIFDLGGLNQGAYLGKGIIGQPKAYVNSQPIRNLLRYLFP